MAEGSPFGPLLERLAVPYDGARVLAALLGIPRRLARQLVGTAVATSDEAERLLEAMPRIVRSMAIATTDRPARCYGELRGPVLWAETMSARSASAGDPGLFVCATTTKAFDTDENRVLKAALDAIRRGAADADPGPAGAAPDAATPVLRRARHNGHRAAHFLEHRTLIDVPVGHVSGRSLRRTRAGSRRGTYQPAVAMVRRATTPLDEPELVAVAGPEVVAAVRRFLRAIEDVEATSGPLPPVRSAHGRLVAGPVAYDHLAGVSIDGQLVEGRDEAPGTA